MIMGREASIQSAWVALQNRLREDVCRNAPAEFEEAAGSYRLKCFGQDVSVCPVTHSIVGAAPSVANLLGKHLYFFELSALWYLACAQDVPLSGRLIRPSDLKSGNAFSVGSHSLPMERLAALYGDNVEDFTARGRELGGQLTGIGDVSFVLYPFPRIPVTFVLWKKDDEFNARANLLLDASCEAHMPQDVIWATALFSTLMLM